MRPRLFETAQLELEQIGDLLRRSEQQPPPLPKAKPRLTRGTLGLFGALLCLAVLLGLAMVNRPRPTVEYPGWFREYPGWLVKLADWVRTHERPVEARRAQLVVARALPAVMRAQPLITPAGYPSIGEEYQGALLDGTKVTYVFRGILPSTSDLPTSGNQLNDAWAVGPHIWIWAIAKGQTRPYWIDP